MSQHITTSTPTEDSLISSSSSVSGSESEYSDETDESTMATSDVPSTPSTTADEPEEMASTLGTSEEMVFLSENFAIFNHVVVNLKTKHCSNPFRKDIPGNEFKLRGAKRFYEGLFSHPSGTVIDHNCSLLIRKGIQSCSKYVRVSSDGSLSINNKRGFANDRQHQLFLLRNSAKQQVYLRHLGVSSQRMKGPPARNYSVQTVPATPVHTHTLETIYNLSSFLSYFKGYLVDESLDTYRIEILHMTTHCFVKYNRKKGLLQLPSAENSSRPKDLIGGHLLTTFNNYSSYMRKVYYYILNLATFADKYDIDEEIASMCSELRNGVGSYINQNRRLNDEVLEQRIVLLRGIMYKICTSANANMFTIPLKAAMIHEEAKIIQNDAYCLKVMDSFKLFLKYLFIFNVPGVPTNVIPHEFQSVFIDKENDLFNQLKEVYHGVYQTQQFQSFSRVTIDHEGEIFVNGTSFSKARMQALYHSFIKTYEECVQELFDIGIDLDSVESVFQLAKGHYVLQQLPFYNCFNGDVVFIRNYDPKVCDNEELRTQVFGILETMTTAVCLLLYFSSGGGYRLFEMVYFTNDNNGTNIGLHKNAWGELFVHIASLFSKNGKITNRLLIANAEVTKFFIHYLLAVLPLKKDALKDLPVDQAVNDVRVLAEDFDVDDAENPEEYLEFGRITDARNCLDRFIFTCPIRHKSGYFIGRLRTITMKNMFSSFLVVHASGEGDESDNDETNEQYNGAITIPSLRQAFSHFNNQTKSQVTEHLTDLVHDSVAINAGHHVQTHLDNYARVSNVADIERHQHFQASFAIMQTLNKNLGFVGSLDDKKADTPRVFKVHLNFNQLKEARDSLYAGIAPRRHQEALMFHIGGTSGTYAFQAETGFGKTMMFTPILRAINNLHPQYINLILVPYVCLMADLKSRLQKLQFTVGSVQDIQDAGPFNADYNVYIGVYEHIYRSTLLMNRDRLGLLVVDECHCVALEDSFRKNIKSILSKAQLHAFERIILMSATLDEKTASLVYKNLDIRDHFSYQNLIESLPNSGRVHISSVVSSRGDSNALLNSILARFLAFNSDGKAVVLCDRVATVHTRFDDFNASVDSRAALMVHGRSADKESVTHSFVQDPMKRILFGTKLISNGIDSSHIQLVVIYNFNPDIVTFIQTMGRIREEGVVLMINTMPCCRTDEMRAFYNIDGDGHESCCDADIRAPFVKKLLGRLSDLRYNEEEEEEVLNDDTPPVVEVVRRYHRVERAISQFASSEADEGDDTTPQSDICDVHGGGSVVDESDLRTGGRRRTFSASEEDREIHVDVSSQSQEADFAVANSPPYLGSPLSPSAHSELPEVSAVSPTKRHCPATTVIEHSPISPSALLSFAVENSSPLSSPITSRHNDTSQSANLIAANQPEPSETTTGTTSTAGTSTSARSNQGTLDVSSGRIEISVGNPFRDASTSRSASDQFERLSNRAIKKRFLKSFPPEYSMGDRTIKTAYAFQNLSEITPKLFGIVGLKKHVPFHQQAKSSMFTGYEYIVCENVLEDPLFVVCLSELTHLVGSKLEKEMAPAVCSVFVISFFETIELSDYSTAVKNYTTVLCSKAYSYLVRFKMLSFHLMKFHKAIPSSKKRIDRWNAYIQTEGKKQAKKMWSSLYPDRYPDIDRFTNDPIFYMPLYIAPGTCGRCFGHCKGGCSSKLLHKGAKLTVFSRYLEGKVPPDIPDELKPLLTCKLFSVYLTICLMANNGYSAIIQHLD